MSSRLINRVGRCRACPTKVYIITDPPVVAYIILYFGANSTTSNTSLLKKRAFLIDKFSFNSAIFDQTFKDEWSDFRVKMDTIMNQLSKARHQQRPRSMQSIIARAKKYALAVDDLCA